MKEASFITVLGNLINNNTQINDLKLLVNSLFNSFLLISRSMTSSTVLDSTELLFESLVKLFHMFNNKEQNILNALLLENRERLSLMFRYCLISSIDVQFSRLSNEFLLLLFSLTQEYELFYNELVNIICFATVSQSRSLDYWELLSNVLNYYSNLFSIENLVSNLISIINTRDNEKNSNEKDTVLCGIFKVLKSA